MLVGRVSVNMEGSGRLEDGRLSGGRKVSSSKDLGDVAFSKSLNPWLSTGVEEGEELIVAPGGEKKKKERIRKPSNNNNIRVKLSRSSLSAALRPRRCRRRLKALRCFNGRSSRCQG